MVGFFFDRLLYRDTHRLAIPRAWRSKARITILKAAGQLNTGRVAWPWDFQPQCALCNAQPL